MILGFALLTLVRFKHQEISPVETIAEVIRGYDPSLPRSAVKIIYGTALGRNLVSVTLGKINSAKDPGNAYLTHSIEPCLKSARQYKGSI